MANLYSDILKGVWMVSETEAVALQPVITSFLNGNNVDLSIYTTKQRIHGYKSAGGSQEQRVVVIEIYGMILKYDYCGDMGMKSFESILNQLKSDPTVGAVVLDIDSGGGEATHMPHVAEAMRQLRNEKPVLVHFSGVCASAAYYIASQATKIYASAPTDRVGSIGTMWGFHKPNENSRAEYQLVSVYATKSTDKNGAYRAALDGDTEPIKEKLLDPFNKQFHQDILLGRPQVDESVFGGADVMADEGIKLNLIDGIKRLEDVIEEAFNLITQ
jgi:protease-4